MKLAMAVAGLIGLAVASALAVQQLNRGEQFRVLMAEGDQALSAGNTYAAIEAYSGAMALRPDSMASHLRRGQAWEAQRRQDEAIRDYVEAARLQTGAADPLLALAELYDLGPAHPDLPALVIREGLSLLSDLETWDLVPKEEVSEITFSKSRGFVVHTTGGAEVLFALERRNEQLDRLALLLARGVRTDIPMLVDLAPARIAIVRPLAKGSG
jgi:tetratricopeptide (TPR) repeat protein